MATSGRAAGDTGPALPELALFAALLSTAMAQCVRPADTIGYELSEVELNITTGFEVVAACAVGYEGSAAVTECPAEGDPYALSGCAPIVCTAPPDQSGYDVAEVSLSRASSHVRGVRGTTACRGAASTGNFTGAAPGEGLDLTGSFVYAVDVGGAGVTEGLPAGLEFTDDSSNAGGLGLTISAANRIADSAGATLPGGGSAAGALETLLSSIRWSSSPVPVELTLTVVAGVDYRLQLLFYERWSDRGFDIFADGQLIVDEYSPAAAQGGATAAGRPGAVVVYDFTAASTTLEIALRGDDASFAETSPILSAFTLERLRGPTEALPISSEVGCHQAAAALGETWGGAVDSNTEPAGCVASWGVSGVSFNVNSAGSAHPDRAAVCNITGSFDVTATCAENYEGNATVAACTTGGDPYTLSGCEPIVCVSPANTAGYETPTETELSTAAGFDVTTTCAAHYVGTAVATACTVNGAAYTLSGCEPIVCTSPADLTGYNTPNEVELDTSAAGGFDVTATCAENYEGAATATACVADGGPYALSGCLPITCTRPTTPGYANYVEANLVHSVGPFDVTVTCGPNYEGVAVATQCDTSGSYTVSGCQQIICTRPTSPGWNAGYNIPTETELSTAVGFDVTSTCHSHYEGTVVVTPCSTSGPYSLSGCAPIVCTTPPDTTGYDALVETRLDTAIGFSVSARCAPGYEGAAVVEPCSTDGVPYTLDGCDPVDPAVCTSPADLTGYNTPNEVELDTSAAGGFDVTATCAANYEGTATATACVADGPYALSGCVPIVCISPADFRGYQRYPERQDLPEYMQAPDETQLNTAVGFDVSTACAAHYEGAAVVTACTANGAPYTLSGCEPIVCTSPDTTGYVLREIELARAEGLHRTSFLVVARCASSYVGTAVVTPCAASGPYTLSGCVLRMCTRPASIVGYQVTETELDTSVGFAVTATCAPNYEGVALATQCSPCRGIARGNACCPSTCGACGGSGTALVPECNLRPGGSDACCADSIAAAGVPCSATGGSGPCVLDGEASAYSLSGCDPIVCTTPADLTGYTVTETELSTATGFSVAAACADNYEGAEVVTPCTTDGPYALAGCESIVCTTPASLTGYRILSEYNLDLSDGAFDVTAACGANYAGAAVATACTTDGEYALSGCAERTCVAPGTVPQGYAVATPAGTTVAGLGVVSCAAGYHWSAPAGAMDLPYGQHSYSSVLNGDAVGGVDGRGRLDSPQAWTAATNDQAQWLQLAAHPGDVFGVTGVVTLGQSSGSNWVTSFKVSWLSGNTWQYLQCGGSDCVFDGNADQTTPVHNTFDATLVTSAVRIHPWAWEGRISMRAGVMVVRAECMDQRGACLAAGGTLDGSVCCAASCGSCGGDDCASRPGGAENCCAASITRSCADAEMVPPCVVGGEALPFSFFGCEENSCSAISLGAGVESGYRDGCVEGMRLTTHTDPTCTVRCALGYSAAPGAPPTIRCASDASPGAAAAGGVVCTANTCAAITLSDLASRHVIPGDVDGCTDGLELAAHGDNSCTVQCEAGYAPQGIVAGGDAQEWAAARSSPTAVTCPAHAAPGDATVGGAICREILAGACEVGTCEPGHACVDVGGGHTCNYLCGAGRFLRREDMDLPPLGDPSVDERFWGNNEEFNQYVAECLPR